MLRATAVKTFAALTAGLALVLAACTSEPDDPEFEGTLSVGVLLPGDGELSYLAPTLTAAVEVAQAEINEAGGVWGNDVTVEFFDQDASPDALVAAGVAAVIGPLATDATLGLLEPLRDAGILLISPASPGIVLDDHPARDYYFRIRPSDVIQAVPLAQDLLALERGRVAIVARDDAYGAGLADQVRERYEIGEEQQVVADLRYQGEPDVAEVVTELTEAEPDAVVIISYGEGAGLMAGLAQAELTPAEGTAWYLVSGNLQDYSEVAELPAGTLAGVTAFAPAPVEEREQLWERMDEQAPGLAAYGYGAEAYDALLAVALGAVVANTDDPAEIRTAMIEASREPGSACPTFESCLGVLGEGETINYFGESGPIDWSDTGDSRQGPVGRYEYAEDHTFSRVEIVPARL